MKEKTMIYSSMDFENYTPFRHNAKATVANDEMKKATEVAFIPIAAGFTFLAALWFLLKKKFWIK